MHGSPLQFTFDNADVAGRFIDGVLAIPNMRGVTITIPGIAASKTEELAATDSQQLKQAIALVRDASKHTAALPGYRKFHMYLNYIEQRACV
jgi:hypothetical protein